MIVDASIFYNEIDMLDLRISELQYYVDVFIVLDAEESFSSNEKRKSLLEIFKHPKLLTLTLPRLHPSYAGPADAWAREHYQRNALMPHIKALMPSDIVMLSDADEIPRIETVLANIGKHDLFVLEQDMYYYNPTNYLSTWNGTVVGTVEAIERVGGPQKAKDQRPPIPVVPNGGWHFSYFGGLKRIREKVKGFSHADAFHSFNDKSDEEALADIEAHRDLFNRPEGCGTFRPLGDHLPISMRNP